MDEARIEALAGELMAVLGTGAAWRRLPDLGMAEAYAVSARVAALRRARGERTLGRKIGFTNVTIWERYGVTGPMWNYVYDRTVRGVAEGPFDLAGLAEPRIEPEIVLRLGRAPEAGMDEPALFGCVEAVAHGFEIVQSVYPGWAMTGPEAAAAFGLHGALLLGPWHDVAGDRAGWAERLARFAVTLRRNGVVQDAGVAANVLGGPVAALRFLVEEIARHPGAEPLAAGEIVSTGTLTDAHPVAAGERWTTEIEGLPPVARLALVFAGERRGA